MIIFFGRSSPIFCAASFIILESPKIIGVHSFKDSISLSSRTHISGPIPDGSPIVTAILGLSFIVEVAERFPQIIF